MRFVSAFLTVAFFCSTSFAEPKAYFDLGWFRRDIVVDGKSYSQHFFMGYPDVVEAMKSNPLAREYAERASSQWMWCNILSTGTLVGVIYLVNTPSTRLTDGTLLAILGAAVGTSILQFNAMLNENRAVNAYNGVTKVSEHSLVPDGFAVVPVAGGASGVLAWSF